MGGRSIAFDVDAPIVCWLTRGSTINRINRLYEREDNVLSR